MILTSLGWLAALGLLALSVSSGWHGFREKARGPWIGAGMYACASVILLAVDGALKPLAAGVLAFLALAVTAGLAVAEDRADAVAASPDGIPDGISWKSVLGSARGSAGAGVGYLGADVRGIWRRLMAWLRRLFGAGKEAGETGAEIAEAVATRGIPPVREDPSLGLPPDPAMIAAVPVPAPYAALAQYISGFEPEDDQALQMFMEGNASGGLVLADAWRHFADTCLNGAGLHPAYVAGVLEVGDGESESAGHKAQVHKRFGVIYGAVKEWVGAHGPLPHKARDFLTGE